MAGVGDAELRQGPTRAGRAHRPRRGARPLRRRPGGGARVRALDSLVGAVLDEVARQAGASGATAAATPAERAAAVRAFVDAAGGLSCAGYVQTAAQTVALGTTSGQHMRGASTSAICDGIARLSGADGVARSMSASFGDLAFAA